MKNIYLSSVFILTVLALSALAATAQSKYSSDNYQGDWTMGSSWLRNDILSHNNGIAPSPLNIPESNRDYFIDGYITRVGDLTFAEAKDAYNFTVQDTLVVTGGITFGSKAMNLKIPAGGILVVFGDFTMNNKIEIENGGYLIVKGNLNFEGGNDQTSYTSSGTGGLYVGGELDGNHTNDAMESEKRSLSDLPPALYKFVSQNPGTGPFVPMPVELLYFSAQKDGSGLEVQWASSKEWSFSHYTLERSHNAKDYVTIHTIYVDGESNNIKKYSYLDTQPEYGVNYYRLKTTDIDGTTSCKGITLAYAGVKGDLQIFPNPSKSGLITIRNPGATEKTWLSIQSSTGQELMRMLMPERELRLPVSVLPSGLYLIKVWNELEVKRSRFVVE